MGLAIASVHYSGMTSVSYMPLATGHAAQEMSGGTNISVVANFAIVLVTLIVLASALLTSVFDHALARQAEEIAIQEMTVSRKRIEDALQRPVVHLAYPYGDKIAAGKREFALANTAGFKTAVTTRPGMIFPESARHLTALPRVSLNGNYQDARILPVLTSGAATAVWNGFRRVDAA